LAPEPPEERVLKLHPHRSQAQAQAQPKEKPLTRGPELFLTSLAQRLGPALRQVGCRNLQRPRWVPLLVRRLLVGCQSLPQKPRRALLLECRPLADRSHRKQQVPLLECQPLLDHRSLRKQRAPLQACQPLADRSHRKQQAPLLECQPLLDHRNHRRR